MNAALRIPRALLDRFALFLVGASILFLGCVSSPFYRWLLVAALLAACYGARTGQRDLIAAACLTPPLYLIGFWISLAITDWTPHTVDAALAQIDHNIGANVWRWCAAHPSCYWVLKPVYYGLGIAIIAGITFCDRRRELCRAMCLAAVGGLLGYFLFPAVGPLWVATPGAVRNCMPSMHLTWALLILAYCPRDLRIPWAIFCGLTALSALGLGEHYAVDLLVAVVFSASVVLAVEKAGRL